MITAANIARSNKQGRLATMYFNIEETRELLSISDFALTLMQHYVALGKQPDPILEDQHLAIMLDKSTKTIEKTRLLLTKAGWFKRLKSTKNGEAHVMYLIGRSVVKSRNHVVLKP